MSDTPYDLVLYQGENATFEGTAVGGGGGSLPLTGWTGDESDPQNVMTNGGQIDLGGGSLAQAGQVSADAVGTDWFGAFSGAGANDGAEVASPGAGKPSLVTYDEGYNNAVFKFFAHIAPADGDLNAGECGIWFDQTNGAAKVGFKAKSANGTVVAGSVDLT